MKRFTFIFILFALMITACQSTGARANLEATNEILKITPSPGQNTLNIALDKNTPSPDDLVVVYERSGGLAGVSEQWSIYAGGKIVKKNGETITVDAAKVTDLLDAIDAAGFYDIKFSSSIGGLNSCKDCFSYTLTVTSNGQKNTITTFDGAKGLPDSFWAILKQVNDLVNPPTQQ